MRRSALKAIRPNAPQASGWAAMLGPDVAEYHGAAMAKIVGICARLRPLYAKVFQGKLSRAQRAGLRARQHRAERKLKRWLAPRLTALLWEALADLNPERIKQLAAVVRAVGAHWADRDATEHVLPFHSRALQLASIIRAKENLARLERGEPELQPATPLPIRSEDFLARLGVKPAKNESFSQAHDAMSYYRRELTRMGIRFAGRKR